MIEQTKTKTDMQKTDGIEQQKAKLAELGYDDALKEFFGDNAGGDAVFSQGLPVRNPFKQGYSACSGSPFCGGSVQQGLSSAGGEHGLLVHRSAADKRYSLGVTLATRICWAATAAGY
jgi:hypothetical protein